jgi:hypothetical protein
MATTKKVIVQVRSNCDMAVDYSDLTLKPQIELILLTQEPIYEVNKKREIEKTVKLGEFRCMTTLEGLNDMISDLQKTASELQVFQQMAGSLNKVVEQYKKPTE